ncbi:Wzz/FepE/Etk N-terminal domain-containing protein [Clostridiaceae bacterium HSG29]|nr:Wzz/FepE/Etk N-terminal domain-containing protein [Clostridiaceae bacterium HSG29]
MENNQSYDYDEISIKELIEVVLKGKKIIAGITIITLLFAFAFTFYIQKPVYESKTTLLARNVTAKVTDTNIESMQDYINNLSIQSLNTLETYKQQIKSPEVLNDVIESLELSKENYSIDRLNGMISVSIIKDTNLLEITVKSGAPETSSSIANGVSDSFIKFINNLNKNNADQSVEFLKIRVDEQKDKLENSVKSYEEFLNENENIDSVRNEMAILLSKQNEYQGKLETIEFDYNASVINNDINIKTTESKLNEVKKVISETNKKLEVNKNVVGDDILREILSESGLTISDMSNINLKEEIYNENYLNLMSQRNNLTITLQGYINAKDIIKEKYNRELELLNGKITDVTEKLENLQVRYIEMNHRNQLLNNEVSNARQTYELLLNKYNETKITESVEAGEMNLVINSKAYASDNPVSPNKKLNLAIALVLGLMIGVFVVFFMNMWKTDDVKG